MSKAEKYIKDFTMHCNNELTFGSYAPWITPENALEAVEIERKEIIKKAVNWLKTRCSDAITDRYFIDDFKQAVIK